MRTRRKRIWTEERIEYLRQCVVGNTEVESLRLFRERYPECSMSAMVNAKVKFNISSGIKGGQFPKGHVPANKGKKGIHYSPATEFKKGNVPPKTKQLGELKQDPEGYWYIKVSMTGKACEKWTQMNIYVWEQTTGEKVDRAKDVVVFLDGNRSNYKFENLQKIPRSVHTIMCHAKWYRKDPEETAAFINLAKLIHATNFQMRKYKLGVYRFDSQQMNSKEFREYLEGCIQKDTTTAEPVGGSSKK